MELMPAVRALHLAALALLAGGFGFPLLVLPAAVAAERERSVLRAWLARLRLCSVLAALVTWGVWLVLVAGDMSGLPMAQATSASVLGEVVGQTRFGHVWLVRCALLLLVLVCHLAWSHRGRTEPRRAVVLGTVLTASLLVSQVLAGHASAAPLSHMAADALHVAAAALWVGSLPPLLVVLAHARARSDAQGWSALAAASARGFTGLGTFAVGTLAITGYFNARTALGSWQALATTDYGRLIAAKLLLFAAMLVLAATNRFRFTPRLGGATADARAAQASLSRSVAAELALGACILAVVGVLGGSAPPAHDRGGGMPMQHGMASGNPPTPTTSPPRSS